MGNIQVDISPPSFWQDFERITLDICKRKWQDDYAERNGRRGQSQNGVDVYGYNYASNEHTGVQCKKRLNKYSSETGAPSNTLTTREINEEIEAAKKFRPCLDRFIIATTGPRDANLQEHVRKLNPQNLPFKVVLWFWDDYIEHLNNDHDLMYRYYRSVLEYRAEYNREEHYYRMLSMAFDRPAIRTPFYLENRATDFIIALAATQNAIATGRLIDNDDHIVDEVRLPGNLDHRLQEIKRLLQAARELATHALREGIIIQHETVIEIKDRGVQEELNHKRLRAVKLLNEILEGKELNPVEIPTLMSDN